MCAVTQIHCTLEFSGLWNTIGFNLRCIVCIWAAFSTYIARYFKWDLGRLSRMLVATDSGVAYI